MKLFELSQVAGNRRSDDDCIATNFASLQIHLYHNRWRESQGRNIAHSEGIIYQKIFPANDIAAIGEIE